MAKDSIRDYSATSSNNSDIQSVDISEGCAPSGLNNAIREVMTDLKNVSTGTVALETPVADSFSTDTISEKTSATGVTIDGVLLKDGAIGSIANAVAAHLTSINGGQIGGSRNLIINGNFSCWQRSTDSETTSTSWAYRTVDRFQINRGRYRKTSDTVDGRTVDVVQIDPASGVYHGGRGMFTMIEDYNVYEKPTVLSVYVKADAATTAEIGQLYDYGGGSTVQAGTSVNITTDWQRFEVQYSAQTFSQAAANYIVNALVDGRTYYVAMAQLEEGTQATPFEHESYAATLQKCQRYHTRIEKASGQALNSSQTVLCGVFPVEMRATPTASLSAALTIFQLGIAGSKVQSSSNIGVNTSLNSGSVFNAECGNFSSLTIHQATAVAGGTQPLIFDAEL